MSISFPKIEAGAPVQRPPESRPRGPERAGFARDLTAAGGPNGPPPEVGAEVRAAAAAASRLQELGLELRFDFDEASGQVRVELRDREGNLRRSVPTAEVFDFAQGEVTE